MFEDDQKQRACVCINSTPQAVRAPVHCHTESLPPWPSHCRVCAANADRTNRLAVGRDSR